MANPVGRPRAITPDVARTICERIARGRTVYNIGKRDDDMPHLDTIYAEAERNPEFASALIRARRLGAYALAESVVDIADNATDDDNPQRIRNTCDQRRWLAGKYNSVFADKKDVTVHGDVKHSHLHVDATVEVKEIFAKSILRREIRDTSKTQVTYDFPKVSREDQDKDA